MGNASVNAIAGLANPYQDATAITTSDTVYLTRPTRGIYVGGTGNITAVMHGGTVILFTAVPVGTVLPISVRRVNATATTATALVALY